MLQYRGRSRPDMAPGCPEHLDGDFIRWIWQFPRMTRPRLLHHLAEAPGERQIVRLRSPRETSRWLSTLPVRDALENYPLSPAEKALG
jgi:hypothetical protein